MTTATFTPAPMTYGPQGNPVGPGFNNMMPSSQLHFSQNAANPAGSVGTGDFSANPAASHVTIDPSILNSMSQYSDAAYQNATRTLDPQWQQKQAAFDQQMVSQGVQPGSQAYNDAYANFSRSQNDAYAQARNAAMTQGLQAQGQAFGEGYQNSTLANELAKAQMAGDAQIQAAANSAGGQTSSAMINAMAGIQNNQLNNQTAQLNDLGQLGLGLGNLQLGAGNLGLGYANLANNQNQQSFGDMLALGNYGRQGDIYNNTLPGQEEGNLNQFLGLIPNGNPYNVDVTGAYGLNQAGQNAQYQGQVSQANGTNQMLGQLGSAAVMMAMMSSRELKDDHGPVDAEKTLEAVKSLPVHRWSYKGDTTAHVGTFAEDFNEALGLPQSKSISIIDMLGALTGSIKALADRLDSIESRLPIRST